MPTAPRVACLEPLCPRPAVERGRCAVHRRTTPERGYGARHQAGRLALAATLPAPCGYCGVMIRVGERWVAAHRIDGNTAAGLMVAHALCNERAKVRGDGVSRKSAGASKTPRAFTRPSQNYPGIR